MLHTLKLILVSPDNSFYICIMHILLSSGCADVPLSNYSLTLSSG